MAANLLESPSGWSIPVLKAIAEGLVVGGFFLVAWAARDSVAFLPTIAARSWRSAWRQLISLMAAFLLGYVWAGWLIAMRPIDDLEIMIAAVLFGGGLFVMISTRISIVAISRLITHSMNLERYPELYKSAMDRYEHGPLSSLSFERLLEDNFAGDFGIFVQVAETFLGSWTSLLSALKTSIACHSATDSAAAIHQLKGAVASFRNREVMDLVAAVESGLRFGDEASLDRRLVELECAMEDFAHGLRGMVRDAGSHMRRHA